MALTSRLFAGDARIGAIAVSDAANVKFGDRGPHVVKIQKALNAVDGAGLKEDGIYGSLTQQAVLAFKRKRNIINRSYQSTPDAIVGKMTIAALDKELCELERSGPITVRVLSPLKSPADDYRDPAPNAHGPMLSFAISQAALSAVGPLAIGTPVPMAVGSPVVATNATIDIPTGQSSILEISGVKSGMIGLLDRTLAKVCDPVSKQDLIFISGDPRKVEILAVNAGSTYVVVKRYDIWSYSGYVTALLVPLIIRNRQNTVYHPTMTPHNHQPSRKWSEVCEKIEQPVEGSLQGATLKTFCVTKAQPATFAEWARKYLFFNPIATKHFDWYLQAKGADFVEDDNIASWIAADKNLRTDVADFVRRNMASKKYSDWIAFPNTRYDSDDHRNSFGTVERLYIEFDIIARYVKIWFKDRYEWHPVCPPYYTQLPDDRVRTTNSLHAALVEMKDQGAADYWMLGECTRSMTVFGL